MVSTASIVRSGTGHRLRDNVAINNAQNGFGVWGGSSHVLTNNEATSNGVGYFVWGRGNIVTDNLAVNNQDGVIIAGGDAQELHRNSIIGNKNAGVNILHGARVTIKRNNIYGNNSVPINYAVNCGIINGSGGVITATNNFWGVATGPGADPADGLCDFGTSRTITEPFATKEFGTRGKRKD